MKDIKDPTSADNQLIQIDLHPALIDDFKRWLEVRNLKLVHVTYSGALQGFVKSQRHQGTDDNKIPIYIVTPKEIV